MIAAGCGDNNKGQIVLEDQEKMQGSQGKMEDQKQPCEEAISYQGQESKSKENEIQIHLPVVE